MASVVAIDGSIPCAACSQSNPRDPDDEVRRVADFIVTANMSSIVGGTMHSARTPESSRECHRFALLLSDVESAALHRFCALSF
jgi:hypothetical protein